MGSIRKMSKAELRQREKDQQDPRWLAWLAGIDADLERFFVEDAPEIAALPDPWTREGLRLAVQAARRIFGTSQAIYLPEFEPTVDRFVRFYGELYRRAFGGRWANIPANAHRDVEIFPVVAGPPCLGFMEPLPQLAQSFTRMISKREPAHADGEPVWVFDNWTRTYQRWLEVGRPDSDEWQKIQLQDLLDGRI